MGPILNYYQLMLTSIGSYQKQPASSLQFESANLASSVILVISSDSSRHRLQL